jgi:hypothetical protein
MSLHMANSHRLDRLVRPVKLVQQHRSVQHQTLFLQVHQVDTFIMTEKIQVQRGHGIQIMVRVIYGGVEREICCRYQQQEP